MRISFTYRGRRYYETLYREATAETVRKAGIKRAAILLEIEGGTFDYRRHFPDSPRALAAGRHIDAHPTLTLGEALEEEARLTSERKAPSTVRSELPRHKLLLSHFGAGQQPRYITAEDVERFKRTLRQRYSAKTANHALVPLRAVLRRAHHRGILERSVHDRFEALPADETRPAVEVLPLTLAELDTLATAPGHEEVKAAALFNAWAGLSLSELVGLAWEDVETAATPWRISVRRARVGRAWKVPKELGRRRTIELNERAQGRLAEQRARTALLPALEVETLQRDNMTRVGETSRPVFRHRSGRPWGPVLLRPGMGEAVRRSRGRAPGG